MIRANEVRLGNWVYDTEGKPNQVNIDALKYLLTYGDTKICQVHPIPLSEEVLLKCGFKKWGRDDMTRTISYELGTLQIFPANSFCDFEGYGFMHVKKEAPIESALFTFQHLHTLQNIAFLLRQELTYTP